MSHILVIKRVKTLICSWNKLVYLNYKGNSILRMSSILLKKRVSIKSEKYFQIDPRESASLQNGCLLNKMLFYYFISYPLS